MGVVSVLSYCGTLLLAHLLDARAYSAYAATATMLSIVGVFAAALIPLPLTAVIRNHPSGSEERRRGVTFAWVVSAVAGLLAAVTTGLIAAVFAPPSVVAVGAASALVLFLSSPVWGWLHGDLLFVRKAVMIVGEIVVRILVSVGMVLLGWRAGGALTGFMAGSAVVLLTAPRVLRRDLAWRPDVLKERARWIETGDLALAQLTVYSLVGADVILIAVLAAHDAEGAGFQALSTLAKAPVFVAAGAVSVAFPLLRSQHADSKHILRVTLRSALVLALSSAAVIATAPAELVLLVFPDRYAQSLDLLPALAAAGVGYAGLTVLTSVMLGLRAYRRCQTGLFGAAVVTGAGMVAGWSVGGVPGLAVGAALGTLSAAGALCLVATPLLPPPSLRTAARALIATGVVIALLVLARSVPILWLCSVLVLGGASVRLVSRGSRSPAIGVR
jgi:O-antigen/teichoic acid export membrane protein